MLAKPGTRSDRVKTPMTNLHRFRLVQCFFDFFVPRVRRFGDLPGPDESAPQQNERKNGQSNFADKTLWIASHTLFNVCHP